MFPPITAGVVSESKFCLLDLLSPAGKKDTRCKFVAKKANWKTSAVSVTHILPLGIAVYEDLPPVGDLKWDKD